MNPQRKKVVCAALAALLSVPAAAWAWEPNRPVEMVVPFSAGGASDQMARAIQGIIAKYELMKQPVIVVNKAGASGAEGLMDVKASQGDANKLLVASSALYTVPLTSKLPFNWRDLTPVAMVAMDEFVLWTNSQSPYDSIQTFSEAAKAGQGNKRVRMGGTSSKREDHMITAMIEKQVGAKFIYVPYKGGGEAATQLSGNHIDANVNNPSESVAQWRAGEHRALCVFAKERMAYQDKVTKEQSWSDIPTCAEQGLDVSYQMLRVVMMPGGAKPEQAQYYAQVMKQVTEKPEWIDYMKRSALKADFLQGKELEAFLEKDEKLHEQIVKDAGF